MAGRGAEKIRELEQMRRAEEERRVVSEGRR
jgi:hypothetical protein